MFVRGQVTLLRENLHAVPIFSVEVFSDITYCFCAALTWNLRFSTLKNVGNNLKALMVNEHV